MIPFYLRKIHFIDFFFFLVSILGMFSILCEIVQIDSKCGKPFRINGRTDLFCLVSFGLVWWRFSCFVYECVNMCVSMRKKIEKVTKISKCYSICFTKERAKYFFSFKCLWTICLTWIKIVSEYSNKFGRITTNWWMLEFFSRLE